MILKSAFYKWSDYLASLQNSGLHEPFWFLTRKEYEELFIAIFVAIFGEGIIQQKLKFQSSNRSEKTA